MRERGGREFQGDDKPERGGPRSSYAGEEDRAEEERETETEKKTSDQREKEKGGKSGRERPSSSSYRGARRSGFLSLSFKRRNGMFGGGFASLTISVRVQFRVLLTSSIDRVNVILLWGPLAASLPLHHEGGTIIFCIIFLRKRRLR